MLKLNDAPVAVMIYSRKTRVLELIGPEGIVIETIMDLAHRACNASMLGQRNFQGRIKFSYLWANDIC